ncbi:MULTISPECIES: hypothetical protein [Undibacterium]|uniref:General secretion pathway protein GspM n=1 Tax=Undibacterium rivi TaxID=2828729 RepID=A0ABS5H584_9BURK|nr:hypothetical protein [Undibacterium rivi]MBR7794046.1 hypothetical protein [Undibacterium rivi]
MQTGERFWQLVGAAIFILCAYSLAELFDSNAARQKQLANQQQLLVRQQAALKESRWDQKLKDAERIQKAWLAYLPAEKSATFAKARLLSDVRQLAKDAGIVGVTVSAQDAEGGEKTDAALTSYGTKSAQDKTKSSLPSGVQMIKVTLIGRFDPTPFGRLLDTLEDQQKFTVVERVLVRGTQLEVNIRCYWHLDAGADQSVAATTDAAPLAKGI